MTDIPNDAGDDPTLPDEPPPDAYEWTAEPDAPDAGGPGAEFVNDTGGDGVPGVRRGDDEPEARTGDIQTKVE